MQKGYLRHFRKYSFIYFGVIIICMLYWKALPHQLFKDPVSTVLLSSEGNLLGARIAADGQWRFPAQDTVPEIFEQTIIAFEDKRFYQHPGVDPFAILRAIRLNINRGEVVSGGSTLSMQVIRLSRKGKGRTVWEKLIEVVLATRMELSFSKEEILAFYASNAPFGGNVVGLDAAAWKYYGRGADKLSWAEAATLAVLPNAPSLIHPGKNRDLLRKKRDFLLDKLFENGTIDQTSLELAKEEALPDRPQPLPSFAPHLLEEIHQKSLAGVSNEETSIQSTINLYWQKRANQIAERYYNLYKPVGIHNLGILVAEVKTGDVKVYVGNTPGKNPDHNCAVNVVPAKRSTGSILKPFLYASMLSEGEILPNMLIPDIPTRFEGYHPTNFDQKYQGAVPANMALARSLNIPAVRMLRDFGINRFKDKLNAIGLESIDRPASDYGLTLVLGGAESTLWELVGAYSGMARNLNNYPDYNGKYESNAYRPLNYLTKESKSPLSPAEFDKLKSSSPLKASAIWQSFEAMLEVSRPYGESFWENYASSGKIAWKTGTSYGFRDAWAIGVTPRYVVGVWVGNADGEGRPQLIGSATAAPILFDMFDVVGEGNEWFTPPYDDMKKVQLCTQSGHVVTELCHESKWGWVSKTASHIRPCPYHRMVYLDPDKEFQVHSNCESPLRMRKEAYFILPPLEEKYYKNRHPAYRDLPPFRDDCLTALQKGSKSKNMQLIYPAVPNSKIYIPKDIDGSLSETVFEATHRKNDAVLFWHLDDSYIGTTSNFHEMALRPKKGKHTLTLVDEYGEYLSINFEILTKEKSKLSD
ncbi:MAG: penicillin-binding protein 1C [Bacteroidia bacterium]|nr:penicillin-binding protein 1C [Bacteroidia bacterium]